MHHVHVAPEARRRGLAALLISAAERDAARRGCDYVVIGAHRGNEIARDTYVAQGYEVNEATFWRFRKVLGPIMPAPASGGR